MALPEQGVLLYYKFVTLPDPEATRDWFERSCSSLALLGRIRIAPGGVNVTVGGSMESLREHIDAVARQELFQGCDFKLAACSRPMDRDAAASCGLDSLSVRLVEEIA
ncbi:rhodanese-like domain-containing protein 6 [Selaginella moellendorffii]|uniref:rhodanese-like domain-containing protein 6 n=1 Tax=Selaginella moellendorffii TaxID=88036 RepID=UPI000D1CF7E6|nr:rhodanese-like domain-containing protein 6 [Selaginella moellendorffii]|eukprot:XP_024523571.1 rhodanese-like domain-containing protein 6 [Selaginella moellendorffii]